MFLGVDLIMEFHDIYRRGRLYSEHDFNSLFFLFVDRLPDQGAFGDLRSTQ